MEKEARVRRTSYGLASAALACTFLLAAALGLSGCVSAARTTASWPIPDSGRPAPYYFGASS